MVSASWEATAAPRGRGENLESTPCGPWPEPLAGRDNRRNLVGSDEEPSVAGAPGLSVGDRDA